MGSSRSSSTRILTGALCVLLFGLWSPAASLPFSPPLPARTLTTKMAALPSGSWTSIAALSGGAGTIKQLQIWVDGTAPADILFRGFFDNASSPQLGTPGTSLGTPALTLALDVLFSGGFTGEAGYAGSSVWFTDTYGCNYVDEVGLGGHVRLDMPYANGFDLQL